jgi:glycosyltransferase involved in cell wall biosynthesis
VPAVSVVIPTFNRPALLARAVDSVLAQTMADLELIVVVDGPDPATSAYLETVTDPRLKPIVAKEKLGAAGARNTGAATASAPWVAFLDDDDEWLPEKLAKQLAIAPAGPAIVMTLSHVVTPEGSFVRPARPYDPVQPFDEWLFDRTTWTKGGLNFMQTSSLMMPRALFDRLQFRHIKVHEDWELAIRAIKQEGLGLVTVPEPLVIHYVGEARPSLSKEATWRGSLAWADAMRDVLTPRAYAGFVLTSVGQGAANNGAFGAVLPLLGAAFGRGRPTAKQLFRFGMTWMVPKTLRRRARAVAQGGTAPEDARAVH